MSIHRFAVFFALLGVLFRTGSAQDGYERFASGPGTILFLAAGAGLPLLRDGHEGTSHFLRVVDALGTSVLLSEGLKRATRVPRPDTGEHDSFPSGHATAAFAVATMEASFHPKEAPLWFLGATAIADSRLVLGRHRISDVLAGAALGFLTARAELSARRGLILSPVIPEGGGLGIQLTGRF